MCRSSKICATTLFPAPMAGEHLGAPNPLWPNVPLLHLSPPILTGVSLACLGSFGSLLDLLQRPTTCIKLGNDYRPTTPSPYPPKSSQIDGQWLCALGLCQCCAAGTVVYYHSIVAAMAGSTYEKEIWGKGHVCILLTGMSTNPFCPHVPPFIYIIPQPLTNIEVR